MQRREFLKRTAASGLLLACRHHARPGPAEVTFSDPELVTLADAALGAARDAGATYADVRIADYRRQTIETREARVMSVDDSEDRGFGVRVIADGTWGFAASGTVTRDEVVRVARRAVAL